MMIRHLTATWEVRSWYPPPSWSPRLAFHPFLLRTRFTLSLLLPLLLHLCLPSGHLRPRFPLSLSLRFSPRVSIPLSCSPLVRVRVLIQPVAGLLTNPSLSFIFLTSCSLRPLRAASSSLSLHSSFLLPPPLALPCSTARQAKTSILSPIASFHGMGRDTYPWEQRRAPIIFFASGTEEKIRRQGTSNVARYGRELSSSVCDGRYNTFYLSAEGGGWRLRAIISWNVLVERARLLFEKYSFWFAGRISHMDLFVENNCQYFFSFFLVRPLFTVPYFSFRYFIYYSHTSKIFYILIPVK